MRNYHHVLFDTVRVRTAVEQVAYDHSWNPLKDYLSAAAAYGMDVIVFNRFQEFLGAERTARSTSDCQDVFLWGVAKISNPRIKYDFVTDLVGGQGVGKTAFSKAMSLLQGTTPTSFFY